MTVNIPKINGRKTGAGIVIMAVLTFIGDVGWVTAETLEPFLTLATFLTGGGLIHKLTKWLDVLFGKGKK